MKRLNYLRAVALASALASGFAGSALSQSVDPDKALADVQQTALSKGPNGETPSPASSVTLTPEEIDKIKGLKAKAAIVMHYAGNDWALAQVAGLKEQFGKMGIEVISVTDAGRLRSGRFQLGEGDELSVIAAAVLGGTSLFGGFGSVVGSIMGALMIGLINNGLILMGLEFSHN